MNQSSKVAVLLADGFEEMEAIIFVDVLRRGTIDVITASISSDKIVKASRNTTHIADSLLSELNPDDFELIFLPGGMKGTENLISSSASKAFALEFEKQSKYIAAICAAPNALRKWGIIKSETKFTAFPGSTKIAEGTGGFYTAQRIQEDGKILTSVAPGSAFEFSLYILEKLTNHEMRKKVEESLHLPEGKV
jgi:4-methyl-5(b-hydroxyethyl)-thiazole monophosphate biosynthesis